MGSEDWILIVAFGAVTACIASAFLSSTELRDWFTRNSPRLVGVLAIVGLSTSLLILVLQGVGARFSERADVSTAVATVFALFAAIAAVSALVWVESSDYKAQQAVKTDTARLRATLRSIMVKGAVLNQAGPEHETCIDLKAERDALEEFVTSTTAFGYWSWVEERGEATPEGADEPWRVFFLNIAYLLDSCDRVGRGGMITWAVRVEKMLADLKKEDLKEISDRMTDLAGMLGTAEQSKDTLLAGIAAVYDTSGNGVRGNDMNDDDGSMARWKFHHLKRKGVADPNVDMFVGVFDNDTEALKAALEAGADTSITDKQVLDAYSAELADFNPDEWSSPAE